MAGRDIRRLVAYATLQSGPEKVRTVLRLVAGMMAVPETRILMIDDPEGIGADVADHVPDAVTLLDPGAGWPQTGTRAWSQRLVAAGADVVVAVGGDGTQRNVAQAGLQVPLLPVAGGTNNVACWLGDQTAAGYAAGQYARYLPELSRVALRAKVLHVQWPEGEDLALIDVAWVRQSYTGAEAVWRPHDVRAMVLAVADPIRPGLSNVGGHVDPLGLAAEGGLWLELAAVEEPGVVATPAIMAPGLVTVMGVRAHGRLGWGMPRRWMMDQVASLALDGERSQVLQPGQWVEVRCRRDGPWMLDPGKILGWSRGNLAKVSPMV